MAGWLSFFCTEDAEDAEDAEALCRIYPWLWELYTEMAEFGRKPKELMTMFSEMLREMDRNTIRYMVDDMKEQIEKGKLEKAALQEEIEEKMAAYAELQEKITETRSILTEAEDRLTETEGKLTATENALAETKEVLLEKDAEIARLKAMLEDR